MPLPKKARLDVAVQVHLHTIIDSFHLLYVFVH